MKKLTYILPTLALLLALSAPAYADYDPSTNYMAVMIAASMSGDVLAGREAEAGRNAKIEALGLSTVKISFDELHMLARVMASEAGSYWLSDEHQRLVGSIVLNRVASPEFPNTMQGVLTQRGQYNAAWKRMTPDERTVRNALYVLDNGSQAPASVVFQSEFASLGGGTWKSISDRYLGTTHFNYSGRPWLYS